MKVLLPDRTLSHSPLFWLARFGWLAIFLLITGMYSANLPHIFQDTAREWQVGEALPAALQLFPSKRVFVHYILISRLSTAVVYISTALVLAWRRSDDWFVLFISATLLLLSYMFGFSFDINYVRYPFGLGQTLPVIRAIMPSILLISFILMFYLFPNGRFEPRWMAWSVLPATVMILLFFTIAIFFPKPAHTSDESGWLIFVFTLLGTVGAGLIGQIIRYKRNTSPEQRKQTMWVLLGLSSMIIGPLFDGIFLEFLLGRWVDYPMRHLISLQLSSLVPMLLPLTIAVSLFRYHLWDVDIIINRTLVYGILTAIILGLYGLGVGLASALVSEKNNWLSSLLALGAALLIVASLRARLRYLADRWLPQPRSRKIEEDSAETAPITWHFRLAQLAWIAIFIFLFRLAVIRFTMRPDLIMASGGDYLVRESLKLSWLPGVPFVHYVMVMRMAFSIIIWLVAVIVFWRKPQDWFAIFTSSIFLLMPFGLLLSGIDTPLVNIISFLGLITIALFPFFFPDGRLFPQSLKWRAGVTGGLLLTPIVVYPIIRVAYFEYAPGEWVWGSVMITLFVFMAAGFVSQVYRYRTVATTYQRQQTKWVLLGLIIQIGWIFWLVLWISGLLAWAGLSEPLMALIMLHLTFFGMAALPITIAISILRFRLWDIDLLINRTLVFIGLTLLVTGAYVILVGIFGVLFQAGDSVVFTIMATGLVAILFHPLRLRLQNSINRLIYGDRDDPITVLSRLSERLAHTAIPAEILPTIVETIGKTLKLPYVAIVQQDTGSSKIVAEYGQSYTETESFPLIYQGQVIGQLLVGRRAAREVFMPAEMALLENIARQAGTTVVAAQLTHNLQHSRQQLVTSREEERRRIRRDLHDGLGPQLATMSLKLDAIDNYLASDPQPAKQLLQELKSQVQDAIQDVRRLVYDLRPPALDQLGLVPALREYAAQLSVNGLQIRIESPVTELALPAAVEVAAYRIALEAMTNAARHSQASWCLVRLQAGGELILDIIDNGTGMPPQPPSGVGLASIRERTAELGGVFSLDSSSGKGTHLSIRLPLS